MGEDLMGEPDIVIVGRRGFSLLSCG
jgi:hypothetical protein